MVGRLTFGASSRVARIAGSYLDPHLGLFWRCSISFNRASLIKLLRAILYTLHVKWRLERYSSYVWLILAIQLYLHVQVSTDLRISSSESLDINWSITVRQVIRRHNPKSKPNRLNFQVFF